MRNIVLTAFTLSALLAAGAASAATRPERRHDTPRRRPAPAEWRQQFFDKIDTNHDGTISRAEYQAWVDGRFAKLDTNGDGIVDADEVATSPMAAERVRETRRRLRAALRHDRQRRGQQGRFRSQGNAALRPDEQRRRFDHRRPVRRRGLAAFKHRRRASRPTTAAETAASEMPRGPAGGPWMAARRLFASVLIARPTSASARLSRSAANGA